MKIKKIQTIDLEEPIELVDINLTGNENTFWISSELESPLYLTHNSNPDIDQDWSDRDKAVKMIAEYFGGENVIPITNINQLQLRSLIKDVARLHGLPFEEINKQTSLIEQEALSERKKEAGFDRQVWVLTYEEAEKHSPSFRKLMEEHPEFKQTIQVLFKQIRGLSRHAGGVVVTENAEESLPLITVSGELQTPWTEGLNYRHLEPFGFIKFDVLGLGTLRIFENTIRKILIKQGKKHPKFKDIRKWFVENLHPDNNLMEDQQVFKSVFWEGKYAGIFQFVNSKTQDFMKQMKPKNVKDIAIATSIFRPGPLCLSEDSEIFVSKQKSSGQNYHFEHRTIKQLYENWNKPHVKGSKFKHELISYDEQTKKHVKNKIIDVVKSGVKEVFSINYQTSSESSKWMVKNTGEKTSKSKLVLKTTLEHKFLTLDGWKPLKDLVEGDYIFILNRMKLHKSLEKNKTGKLIPGQKHFRTIAFRNYKYKCLFCNWDKGSLDVNHIEENRTKNNNPENLCFLCPNHHREFSEGSITKEQVYQELENHKLVLNEDVFMVRYISCQSEGFEETYDICMESPHNNFFAGGLVVHNSLGVDKQFLQNRANPSKIVYQHPLLKDVYKETSGLLIFQEQLMYIYNKLAGVPLEDTDKVRKAFTKKDISNTAKAQQDRDNLRVDFTKKCKEVNNISEVVSGDIFDNMEKLVSYSFNLAHAVSYAITTYQCAWLLNYYPDEWITSYLDYCTVDKGTATGKEDPKATALREALVLGYKIGKPDINKSDFDFVLEEKTLIPSAASLKYVGKTALAEIKEHRPYTKVEDLLVIGTNTWKHTKFNKRSLDTLIKLEALDSMDLVGSEPHHLFKHYKDMHRTLIGGYEDLKKASMRKKNNNVPELLAQRIQQVRQENNPDWTDDEKMEFGSELAGSFSFSLVISPEARDKLYSMGFMSVDEYEAKGKYWAAVKQCIIKTTKTGRPYLFLKLFGESGQIYQCYCWNYSAKQGIELPKENDIVVLPLEQSEMGFKSFAGSLYIAEKAKLTK
jgi:DNA polymerase III alpha subunit